MDGIYQLKDGFINPASFPFGYERGWLNKTKNYWGDASDGSLTISQDTVWDSGNMVTAMSESPGSDSGAAAGNGYRIRIPASKISAGGGKLRISLRSSSGSSLTVSHVAIVEAADDANGTTVPTEIKFNGGSGCVIPVNSTLTSDWLYYEIDSGKDYIIIIDHVSGQFKYGAVSGYTTYYKAETQSWDQQNVSGFNYQSGYLYYIVKIEVGETSECADMIVRNFVDLTINPGVTLSVKARKGLLMYIAGKLTNYGRIKIESGYQCDPISEGVPSTGISIIRQKDGSTETLSNSDLTGCGVAAIAAESHQEPIEGNGKIYAISRSGAAGGAAVSTGGGYINGNPGYNGSGLQSGGGGSGGVSSSSTSGKGESGTCFGGGSGGGGAMYLVTAGAAQANAGAGGNGAGSSGYQGGGGAGNPGGSGANGADAGESVTGGLGIILVKSDIIMSAAASIEVIGGDGGDANASGVGGGASGGGILLVLYAGKKSADGICSAAGGIGGEKYGQANGGNGGDGTVTFEKILR